MKTPTDMQRSGSGKSPGLTPVHASKRLITWGLSILALPGLLAAQTLQHRYSFVSDASDSVGSANGTIVPPNGGSPVTIANGLQLPGGGGGKFSGTVSLPAGILTTTTNLTIECWLTQNTPNTWATTWAFANNEQEYTALVPDPGEDNGNIVTELRENNNEIDVESGSAFPSGSEQYVTFTFNASTLVGELYTNGVSIAETTYPNATYIPGTLGGASGTAINTLGSDVWGDPQFQGTIYELRIWNGVVSQRYMAASAIVGSGVLITNLTPASVVLTAGPSVIITGTEQATATVQLPQTGSANLLATGDAVNWTSSNPNVLAVNSKGLITGVGVGTATVSAEIGGISATSGTITVSGPQTLLHRYSFVSDASDSVGTANGTLVTGTGGTTVTINNGLILPGNQQGGYGNSGYVALPSGILTNTTSITVECWATQAQGNGWAELWDFGNNGSQNFALIPYPDNNGTHMEVAFTPNGGEEDLQSSLEFPNGSEQYVCLTYNNYSLVGDLYTNGTLVATTTLSSESYCPGTIGGAGGTTENALGNDVYGDWQFSGTVYEFRIWNGAVSPAYVAASAVAGSGVVITNLTPTSLSISLGSTSMIGAGTQQASVSGSFVQASGVNLTGAATNWTSSNPNVLTVSSSGLITAINGGTATVSAMVDGVSATSATITVASTPPVFTQLPANVTAVNGDTVIFSVAALGGDLAYQWSLGSMPIAGATNSSLTLVNIGSTNAGTYSVLVSNNLGSTNASATLTIQQAVLLHRYSFVSDASDSVGGANGAIIAPANANGGAATIANGLSLPGNTSGGFGYSGYVSLPAGLLTNTTSLTVEVWVTQNQGNEWATVWDFGNNGSQNFELCPVPASGRNSGNMISAFTPNGNEVDLNTPTAFPNGVEQYVSETFSYGDLTASLYTNGVLDATAVLPNATYRPGAIGGAAGTSENMLGNDVYGDDQFSGTIYEFRIWDGAVSPVYIALSAIAGPGVVVSDLTPSSLSVIVPNASMTGGQSQQASVTGNFTVASGINVTAAVTNWLSSNPSVLTVSSSGLITAVGTGTATISATVNGATGTSATITVPNSAPIIISNPESAETLIAGATLTATVANNGTAPISVSTSPTLKVPNIPMAANGNTYSCLISNAYGTAKSSALSLTVVAPTPYEQAALQYKPLAFWPLNEASGTVAYDVIGGYNGTYLGGFTLAQTGPANTFFGSDSLAVTFDGSSGYVDIPEGPFNITNAITVVVWVNMTGPNGFEDVIGHGDKSWRISISTANPGGNDGNVPSDATSSTSINDGNWHQIVYTYNGFVGQGNNGSLYVDGVLAANNEVNAVPPGDNDDVWIAGAPDYGTGAGERLAAATIADVSIFAYGFTANQVTGLFNGNYVPGPDTLTITPKTSGLELNWEAGVLLQAPTLTGPWTPTYVVPPYTVQTTGSNQYFKLLINP
jgi:uncharacterized protein YjdB